MLPVKEGCEDYLLICKFAPLTEITQRHYMYCSQQGGLYNVIKLSTSP